ncbi:MAG: MmcQ/YjbR family DNA-binding protein [Clostridia bacterium]|nr:MmcQ/YjbR family DNA-binding protein [Clostridia bacterium]
MRGAVRSDVYAFVAEEYGVEPEYLWADAPGYGVLRHPMSKKWFGIVMDVPYARLRLDGEGSVDVLNVKLLPEMRGGIPTEPGFLPAYHMSHTHWVSILLDGSVPKEKVFAFIEASYSCVESKARKRRDEDR